MKSCGAFAMLLILMIGLSACGRYGPPVRTVVPKESPSRPQATETQPQVPEETTPEPAEFEEDEWDDFDDDERNKGILR